MPRDVFLLSPAYGGGKRAQMLVAPKSAFASAVALSRGELTLGEAYTFMSGLYFRGKLAYGERFGEALVITPTRGLVPPRAVVSAALLREFSTVDITLGDQRYRAPIDRDARALAARLPTDARVVLLGSIATTKYVEVLQAALGERLYFPPAFIGRGDMSRGGLLLRHARSGVPLEYAPLSLDVGRRGRRPPKLPPVKRRPVAPVVELKVRRRRRKTS